MTTTEPGTSGGLESSELIGTPDHLQTNTGVTEHSEDTISASEDVSANAPESKYSLVSTSADDSEGPEVASQAHKQAINSNLAMAPAPLQEQPTAAPLGAPVASSQNTTALAPEPDIV